MRDLTERVADEGGQMATYDDVVGVAYLLVLDQ
jgi:hypothetical protein